MTDDGRSAEAHQAAEDAKRSGTAAPLVALELATEDDPEAVLRDALELLDEGS